MLHMSLLNQSGTQCRVKLCSLLLAVLLFSEVAQARPKIGLALGGGGAKGSAHIGVLRVLEQHNIPIDYIAGTSIGSVIGGMYATGLTVDEIQKIVLETPWEDGYSDRIPREDLPWRVKQQEDQFNIPLEMGVEDDRLKLPSGLLYGQKATKLLRAALGEHPNFDSFDDLAIPYRAIATDLASYEVVIINGGSLITAMRASSSVPGALAPEDVAGVLLVDGGITKNLPVDVVRNMGADIIIAVDIGSDLLPKEELESTFAVIGQLSSFLTSSNAVAQKALLSDDDFLIEPDIDGLSTTDWSAVEEAVARGEAAAQIHSLKLSALSLDDASYNDYLVSKQAGRALLLSRIDKPITQIKLDKKSSVSDALILDRVNLSVGDRINAMEINAAVDRLFSIDEFQRVDAMTLLIDEEKTLQIIAEEKSWGPNFLQFGIGWEDDLDNNSDLNFDIAYTLGNLTDNGGELRSELEMGTLRSFDSELYLPLDSQRDFYSSSRYLFSSFEWEVYVENTPLVPIDQRYHSISQGIGYNYAQPGFVEVGLTTDYGAFSDPVFLGGEIDYFTYGGYLKFGFDTLDSINFPTQGSYFTFNSFLRYEEVDDHPVLDKKQGVDRIVSLVFDVNWKGALKFGNHAVVAKASYSEAVTEDDNESIYISYLGGFLNLSGYHKNALAGSKKAFSAGTYQYDLGKSLLHLEQFPLYLGLSIEAGNVWQQQDDIDQEELILASSAYLGTDTALGPVALGYGRTNKNDQTFYFYLGKAF
jgi:NTE family protein